MASDSNILHKKLSLPSIGVEALWRSRLIEKLSAHENVKVTIVSAPTGYGKTVLISQYVSIGKKSVVWYQLDEFDNDLSMFVRYLISGISKEIPDFGMQTLAFLEQSKDTSPNTKTIVTLLVNELEARIKGRLEIVLDDYHLIAETEIHKFIEQFIQYIPQNILLIISTRYEVPFHLIRLKAHGLVNEVKYNDLKFSNEEIHQLFNMQKNSFFTEEAINRYEIETDGWAVALSLIKKASEVNINEEQSMQWEARKDIYTYFMEEVFQQLPLEIQTFLIHTSVLDVLTPDICNVLTKRVDSKKIIQNIQNQNIFLISYEASEIYYRYHHLFKEFLQKRLGDEKKPLFKIVGEYCENSNHYEEGIENYLLSETYENASRLIDKIGTKMVKDGKWRILNRWMTKLPMKLKENSPVYIFLEADMYNKRGMWDEALALTDRVIELYNQQGSIKDWMISRFQKAIILRRSGRLKESLDVLNKTIAEVEELPFIDWYDLVLEKVNTLLWSSDLNEAAQTLKRGIEFGRRDGEHRLLAYFMENLGATYYAMGEYSNAIAYYDVSKEEYLTEKDSLSEIEKERYSQRTTLSAIYRDWGELNRALHLIQEEIEIKERLGLIDDLPRAYNQLALICNDKGQKQEAEKNFRHASDLYEQLDRKDFQWTWHLAVYGNILLGNGKKTQGKKLLEKSVHYAEKISEFNLALCRFVGCFAYIGEGRIQEGLENLEYALKIAQKVGANNLICQCNWALSNVYAQIGQRDKSIEHAVRCFELASKEKYMQIFLSYEQISFPIIKLGIEIDIEIDFIIEIIQRLGSKSVPMLKELMKSQDSDIKRRAKALLIRIDGGEHEVTDYENLLDYHDIVKSSHEKDMIYVRCFGNFEVYGAGDEKTVQWKTNKAMELFAYLMINIDKTVSKEKILEDLWPGMSPEQTSLWLHTYIYQIRSVLRKYGLESGLKYKNKGYCLNGIGLSSDVNQFEKILTHSMVERGDYPVEYLRKVIQLYRGEFLDGFYNTWIMEEKHRLERLYLTTLERLAKIYIELKEYQYAIEYLHMLLRTDPLSENAHQMLMMTYEKTGDRTAMINHFEAYCKTLNDELGIEPKKTIKALYNRCIR